MHLEFLSFVRETQKIKIAEGRCKAKVKRNTKIELLHVLKGSLQGFLVRKNKGRTEDEFRAMNSEQIFHESKEEKKQTKQPNRKTYEFASVSSAIEVSCFQLNFLNKIFLKLINYFLKN